MGRFVNPWRDLQPVGDDPVWLTANLRRVPLSKMDDEHLQKLERMLLGRGSADPRYRQVLFERWYDVVRNEVDRRRLMLLEDHPRAIIRQERDQNSRIEEVLHEAVSLGQQTFDDLETIFS